MTDLREDLIEAFRGFSDEYILERLQADDLTEAARGVAELELIARGIDLPRRQPTVAEWSAERKVVRVEFITIARFLIPMDAHILRGRLQAEGIPAIVADGNLTQTNGLLSVAVGGARVQVPVPYVAEAMGVMAALRSGALALRENEDLGH
ncbi:MAG TPA: hypothetical protein VEV20_06810 [Burkholderiales bacterium]|nr:hypothetical protein [Burkholderiales bacterium]